MAKYLKNIGQYRVYELTSEECKEHGRVFPTFVCWKQDSEEIGNMSFTDLEARSISEIENFLISVLKCIKIGGRYGFL